MKISFARIFAHKVLLLLCLTATLLAVIACQQEKSAPQGAPPATEFQVKVI
jgi:hypothetical protein